MDRHTAHCLQHSESACFLAPEVAPPRPRHQALLGRAQSWEGQAEGGCPDKYQPPSTKHPLCAWPPQVLY